MDDRALVIRPSDLETLHRLHIDGAWRTDEVANNLTNAEAFTVAELVTETATSIGAMTLLTSAGQDLIGVRVRDRSSPARQLDRAYVRLCLRDLGWSALSEVQDLRQYDTSGRMTAVRMTAAKMPPELATQMAELEGGRALVIGKLPAGYSPSGIKELVWRLRSQALFRDFWVVIFAPRPRRGQEIASQHQAWLRVIPWVPKGAQSSQQLSVTRSPDGPIRRPGEEQRYLARAAEVRRPYGKPWLDVLGQPRAERIEAFRQALEVDGVLAEQQLWRYFGLKPADLEAVPSVEAQVRPIHSRPGYVVRTRFHLRQSRLQYRDWSTLSHAAGTAEMRLLKGIAPNPAHYRSNGLMGRKTSNKPDAIYYGEFGPEALEYDTGSYTMGVIESKLSAFRDSGYDSVIWGVPAPERQARLSRDLDLYVINPRWF